MVEDNTKPPEIQEQEVGAKALNPENLELEIMEGKKKSVQVWPPKNHRRDDDRYDP